jgi:hypothetical protein
MGEGGDKEKNELLSEPTKKPTLEISNVGIVESNCSELILVSME